MQVATTVAPLLYVQVAAPVGQALQEFAVSGLAPSLT